MSVITAERLEGRREGQARGTQGCEAGSSPDSPCLSGQVPVRISREARAFDPIITHRNLNLELPLFKSISPLLSVGSVM